MKVKKILTLFIAMMLLSGSVLAHGDTVTTNSASAGASFRLEQYLNTSGDALLTLMYKLEVLQRFSSSSIGSTETLDPVAYAEPKIGIVCCSSTLNIRESESVVSDVLTYAYAMREITVLGEHQIQGKLWYRVSYNGISGYASSDYIKFGDDAIMFFTSENQLVQVQSLIPGRLTLHDDISALPASVQDTLTKTMNNEVNYCLKVYPIYLEQENYVNVYSVLEHALRNYQTVLNTCSVYSLDNTYYQAAADMTTVGLLLENLVVTTGTSSADFNAQIEQLARQRQKKKELTIGEKIAEYAASFVDILPYVWGGASLTRGADCSGFVAQIYAHFGYIVQEIANKHYLDSRSLRNVGRPVPVDQMQPGDLICYDGHVAIYYGNGKVVHEPARGWNCSFGNAYMKPILAVRRLIPEGQ
ncbi:MAG: C40 family peptidase [Lachnospiraceae bacterium]|nr:C40 family peptidase [Lachnospiraceae bacterium]